MEIRRPDPTMKIHHDARVNVTTRRVSHVCLSDNARKRHNMVSKEIRCFLTCGRVEIPHFPMSFGACIAQFLGVTSGWAGVTITKFFTIRSPLFL
jgi:hypothetical protein